MLLSFKVFFFKAGLIDLTMKVLTVQRLTWTWVMDKSYKNRKVSLTIHCKYKYFDSTVQRAEDRLQTFYFCGWPFAVNVKLNLSISVSDPQSVRTVSQRSNIKI